MFGIGLPELAIIAVVALVMFGPDRLPEFARQAGKFVRAVRQFAASAESQLREELGPEFQDLRLSDLDPRQAIRKHIFDALDDEHPEPSSIETGSPAAGAAFVRLPAGELPPYDAEAT